MNNIKAKDAKNKKTTDQLLRESSVPDESGEAYNGNRPPKEAIEQRAYERYIERGGNDGHDLDDWIEAERELQNRHNDTFAHSDR